MANKPPETGPDGKPIWARNAKGEPICGRKLTNKDQICQCPILADNGRCGAPGHGGQRNRGGAPIKHGLRSKALKNLNLAKKFADALSDPDLASHEANIALCEVLIAEQLEGTITPTSLWTKACELYGKFVEQQDMVAIAQLKDVLIEGAANATRLDNAVKYMAEQRKHKDSESRRRAEIESNLNARQATALVAALIASIEEEEELTLVIRRRIQARLARHLNRQVA